MHSSKTRQLHSLPRENLEWKQWKSKKYPPSSLIRGNADRQNLSNAFPRICSEGQWHRRTGRWEPWEWGDSCREAKERSKGRWRESKSARFGSFADRADALRDKFSAFREFLILRWLFSLQSQCFSEKTWFVLTIFLIKSVQKAKSSKSTDYSSEKVSAFREKQVLRWLSYPKSQCF